MTMLITEGNALQVTGNSFRWCKDTAIRLRVPILKPSRHKHAIRADLFIEALERADTETPAKQGDFPALVDCGDPAAAVRAMLGKKRVGAR